MLDTMAAAGRRYLADQYMAGHLGMMAMGMVDGQRLIVSPILQARHPRRITLMGRVE